MKRIVTMIVAGLLTATTFATLASCTEPLPGDDNRDGIVMEDESGWNCHTMGNRICL